MLDLVPANLPKNINGFRTTHTCELCGFEPKTKNKYREKQDHLVMKHFKEKIDKIFPHCRPYSCPTQDCTFTGKDKQALLRHYTGKHGILEKYLREALAEKGISYVPGDHGGKRKNSDANGSNGGSKAKKMAVIDNTSINTILQDSNKDMLPKSPIHILTNNQTVVQHQQHNGVNGVNGHHQNGVGHHNGHVLTTQRPNNEELRKEVEAMMASFQPQPQQVAATNGSSSIKVVASLPTTPMPITMTMESGEKKTVILSNKGPNNQTVVSSAVLHQQPPSSVVSLVRRSDNDKHPTILMSNGHLYTHGTVVNGQRVHLQSNGDIAIPELILPTTSSNNCDIHHIEVITTMASTNGGIPQQNGNQNGTIIVENEEVMWGSGTSLGPAVVVEAADTVPVTYIESTEIVYSATSLDNIDYDYLYPVTAVTTVPTDTLNAVNNVRERQLEFSML
jgi:hypothetical protein